MFDIIYSFVLGFRLFRFARHRNLKQSQNLNAPNFHCVLLFLFGHLLLPQISSVQGVGVQHEVADVNGERNHDVEVVGVALVPDPFQECCVSEKCHSECHLLTNKLS